jgi:hypothetical protein
MQAQLTSAGTLVPVHILGINAVGQEASDSLMTAGRSLPWLQDTTAQDVWGSWLVTWRDVVVLDAQNRPIAIYNLTVHDLVRPAAMDSLRQLLTAAAQ